MKEFPYLSMDDIDMNIDINLDTLLMFLNNHINDYNDNMDETDNYSYSDPDSDYQPDTDDSANFSSDED
jgi:hypothetical protein